MATTFISRVLTVVDEVSLLQLGHNIKTGRFDGANALGMRTPLSEFRDAVVRRPTPPNAFTPIKEIEMMSQQEAQTPAAQMQLCTKLLEKCSDDPTLQEPFYIQGAHTKAINAMKSYTYDAGVQIQCTRLLGWMVQWNWVLARALADAGALDAIVTAIRNNPDNAEVRMLSGDIGSFTDFDVQNKRRLVELGLVGLVYNSTDKHYATNEVAQMYNLWSTLCNLPDVAKEMVEKHGELERGVKAMKDFRSGTVRGEVIVVHGCLASKTSYRERMLAAGLVPEILSAMRDEISGANGELDTVGKPRLLSNALMMLRVLATECPAARAHIVAAGAPAQVLNVLEDDLAHGDRSKHGFAELQHDLWAEACETLAALMGDTPAERQMWGNSSLSLLPSVPTDPSFAKSLPRSCFELLGHP